jgi:hypothetical protein
MLYTMRPALNARYGVLCCPQVVPKTYVDGSILIRGSSNSKETNQSHCLLQKVKVTADRTNNNIISYMSSASLNKLVNSSNSTG